jgi:uncharacterized caspase-like protein
MRARLLLTLLFVAALASPALAEKRVAPVVSNSASQNVTPLDDPANDATLLAQTLKELGFSLPGNSAQLNLDKRGLDDVVHAFGGQVQGADVAMFYYAGHGVQMRGLELSRPRRRQPDPRS